MSWKLTIFCSFIRRTWTWVRKRRLLWETKTSTKREKWSFSIFVLPPKLWVPPPTNPLKLDYLLWFMANLANSGIAFLNVLTMNYLMLRMCSSPDRIAPLDLYYFVLPQTHIGYICCDKDNYIYMYAQWCTDTAFEAGLLVGDHTHSWLNHKLNWLNCSLAQAPPEHWLRVPVGRRRVSACQRPWRYWKTNSLASIEPPQRTICVGLLTHNGPRQGNTFSILDWLSRCHRVDGIVQIVLLLYWLLNDVGD